MNKYASNISKGCVLEVGLEYPKALPELQNDYPLATDKIAIKREMLSKYHLLIAQFYWSWVSRIISQITQWLSFSSR